MLLYHILTPTPLSLQNTASYAAHLPVSIMDQQRIHVESHRVATTVSNCAEWDEKALSIVWSEQLLKNTAAFLKVMW